VIVRTLIFAGSDYGFFYWIKALKSPKSALITLLEPLEDKFILSIEAVTYISYMLLAVHFIIFTIVFYKLFSKALIMYHHNLFQITHQAKNQGAFAAMTWVGFVASVAFIFSSMKRFVV
jgi:hypothetical protein